MSASDVESEPGTAHEPAHPAAGAVHDAPLTEALASDGFPSGVPLTALPLSELLDAAQRMAGELARRTTEAGFVNSLAAVERGVPDAGAPTLAHVQVGLERLARTVDAARTAVAGHTDRVFDSPRERSRLLGLPPGKTGFRSSADFLERTLQIPRRDAQNRVARAQQHLGVDRAGRGEDGAGAGSQAGAMPHVAGALWDGAIDSATADLVTKTLNDARVAGRLAGAPPAVIEQLVRAGEERLMAQAVQVSPTTLGAICRRWRQRFDAAVRVHGSDADDRSVAEARSLVYRGKDRGLHQWLLNLTDDQHEIFKTVASAGSNPRAGSTGVYGTGADGAGGGIVRGEVNRMNGGTGSDGGEGEHADRGPGAGVAGQAGDGGVLFTTDGGEDGVLFATDGTGGGTGETATSVRPVPSHDPRQRSQREVDAVISALQAALAVATTGDLSATGGSRPQVLVTIDVETLTDALLHHPDPPEPPAPLDSAELAGTSGDMDRPMTSTATFAGPIDPRIIRAWACDADLIPVVLGGEGQVLDVGRAQRLFPLRLRRAIIARDQGCAAPGCSIPAPWCDVHHVQYWENGGPTSVDNGVLLCQHHHQAVHHRQWRIEVRNGVPWFLDTGPRLARPDRPEPVFERNAYWHDAA